MIDRYLDYGGAGPLIHHAPANGFPPEAYRPLAGHLAARYRVVGYRPRPLWPGSRPAEIQRWHDLTHDLLRDVTALAPAERIVGMGHSLGGIITLYAALLAPERFRALVLIDPVLLPRRLLPLLWLMRRFNQHRRSPLARRAARRRASFAGIDEARSRYHGRGIFADFDAAALEGYLEGGLRPDGQGGVTLAWPKEWETHIFSLVPVDTWNAVSRVRVPLMIIRGANSDTVTPESWAHLQRTLTRAHLVELPGSHMVPMEQPAATAAAVLEFLAASPA